MTSTQSPVSTQSPSISSLRSVAVAATRPSLEAGDLPAASGNIARLKVFAFPAEQARPITHFGSGHATATPLTVPEGDAHAVCIRLGPGGVLGRHAGALDQLFVVVEGAGSVAGADGAATDVEAGAAVFWPAGEEHETRTETGLTAIVIESPRIVTRA